ncbi:hypothetical protein ACLOJK_014034 [Asimina triloba]
MTESYTTGGDDDCVKILKQWNEAIPKNGGTAIIVEMVMLDADKGGADVLKKVKLATDMAMMVCTGGRERSLQDRKVPPAKAGFEASNITPISLGQSVIEARPLN